MKLLERGENAAIIVIYSDYECTFGATHVEPFKKYMFHLDDIAAYIAYKDSNIHTSIDTGYYYSGWLKHNYGRKYKEGVLLDDN